MHYLKCFLFIIFMFPIIALFVACERLSKEHRKSEQALREFKKHTKEWNEWIKNRQTK